MNHFVINDLEAFKRSRTFYGLFIVLCYHINESRFSHSVMHLSSLLWRKSSSYPVETKPLSWLIIRNNSDLVENGLSQVFFREFFLKSFRESIHQKHSVFCCFWNLNQKDNFFIVPVIRHDSNILLKVNNIDTAMTSNDVLWVSLLLTKITHANRHMEK